MTTVYLVHGLLFWAGSADLCWILLRCLLSPGRVTGGLISWDVHSHVWKLAGHWSGIGWLLLEALRFQQVSCVLFIQWFQSCKDGKIRSYENFLKIFIYLAAPALSCGMQNFQFPNQGSNLGPLHWEHGVLAAGPPGKSLVGSVVKNPPASTRTFQAWAWKSHILLVKPNS